MKSLNLAHILSNSLNQHKKKFKKSSIHLAALFEFLFLNIGFTNAQNILINPSFEEENICCEGKDNCNPKGWFTLMGSNGFLLTNTSHKGKNCIQVYCARVYDKKYRTYFMTPLLARLTPGNIYTFTCYVKANGIALSELGIYFMDSLTIPKLVDTTFLHVNADIKLSNDNKILYKRYGWLKLMGTYKANGHEKSLIIGNFISNNLLRWKRIKRHANVSNYYIDDVSLVSDNNDPVQYYPSFKDSLYGETRRHYFNINCKGSINIFPDLLKPNILNTDTFTTDKSYILNNIFFDFGQSIILKSSFEELNNLTNYLLLHPEFSITITGHTDNIGDDVYNKQLSEDRATAVVNYLKQQGIDQTRMTAIGKGSKEPIVSNDTEQGRERNRRIEITISK
jgi:OOP family OmpA-OmpF porin